METQEADLLVCEYDLTRIFGLHDIGKSGLTSGWSSPEAGHVWNDGPESIFKVRLPVTQTPCVFNFEGVPFLNSSCVQQDITFFVNGFRLGFWRLTEPQAYNLTVSVQPEHLFKRGNKAIAHCVWSIPQSVRPSNLGLGADDRELGFCFRSFTPTKLR